MKKTVAADGSEDYTTIEAAVTALAGSYSEDVIIEVTDTSTYDLSADIDLGGIEVSSPHYLYIQSLYDRDGRPTIKPDAGVTPFTTSDSYRIHIKGFEFDMSNIVSGAEAAIQIMSQSSAADIKISDNIFTGSGYEYQYAIKVTKAAAKSVAQLEIWNNLFKANGRAIGLKSGCTSWTNIHRIWNNTFAGNNYCIFWYEANAYIDASTICIVNNIFDLGKGDESASIAYSVDSVAYDISTVDNMDYNMYYQRYDGALMYYSQDGLLELETLVDFQTVFPALDQNSFSTSPMFKRYGQNFHPSYKSDAYLAGTTPCAGLPVRYDLNQEEKAGNTLGAYRVDNTFKGLNRVFFDENQQATLTLNLEDLRSSGDERNIRVDLDCVRLL